MSSLNRNTNPHERLEVANWSDLSFGISADKHLIVFKKTINDGARVSIQNGIHIHNKMQRQLYRLIEGLANSPSGQSMNMLQ